MSPLNVRYGDAGRVLLTAVVEDGIVDKRRGKFQDGECIIVSGSGSILIRDSGPALICDWIDSRLERIKFNLSCIAATSFLSL